MPTYNLDDTLEVKEPIISAATGDDDNLNGTYKKEAEPVVTEIAGLNQQELQDPNAIRVVIQSQDVPIVVFFGPPTCGKTMTLIRLSRYLKENGYGVEPVRSFRPGYDAHYRAMCDNFNVMINSDLAQVGNNLISFMLVEVSYHGRPLCQILEAPGEHYFKPKDPNAPFPAYINAISASPNRKLWGFFIEPDHTNNQMEHADRLNYVGRIARFKSYMHPRDKVTIIFNKIDQTNTMRNIGSVDNALAAKKAKDIYPGLFPQFANQNPITKWWKPMRADFVPYMNGYFTDLANGGASFQLGNDNFPRNLWRSITKSIKG